MNGTYLFDGIDLYTKRFENDVNKRFNDMVDDNLTSSIDNDITRISDERKRAEYEERIEKQRRELENQQKALEDALSKQIAEKGAIDTESNKLRNQVSEIKHDIEKFDRDNNASHKYTFENKEEYQKVLDNLKDNNISYKYTQDTITSCEDNALLMRTRDLYVLEVAPYDRKAVDSALESNGIEKVEHYRGDIRKTTDYNGYSSSESEADARARASMTNNIVSNNTKYLEGMSEILNNPLYTTAKRIAGIDKAVENGTFDVSQRESVIEYKELINSSVKEQIEYDIRNINENKAVNLVAKDVRENYVNIIKNNVNKLPKDKKGNLDFNAIERMSKGELSKLGLTEKDQMILVKGTKLLNDKNAQAVFGNAFSYKLNTTVAGLGVKKYATKAVAQDEETAEAMSNSQKAVTLAKKSVKATQDMSESARAVARKLKEKYNKALSNKQKGKLNKIDNSLKKKADSLKKDASGVKKANTNLKKAEKKAKKLEKQTKRITKYHNSTIYKAKNKIATSIGNTKLGRLVKGFTNVIDELKKKILSKLTPVASAFLIFYIKMATAGAFLVLIVCLILSLFDDPTESVCYHLADNLKDKEQKWCEALKDNGLQFGESNWGKNFYSFRRYQEMYMPYAEMSDNYFYINPFYDESNPFDVPYEACKKVNIAGYATNDDEAIKDDIYVMVNYVPNFRIKDQKSYGGHTSNIKDIICMLDVMMQFDEDTADEGLFDLSLSDNKFIYDCKKFANDVIKLFKIAKSIVTFNEDEFIHWKNVSTGASYKHLEMYCDGLFEASHQNMNTMNVVFFDVTDEGKQSGAYSDEVNTFDRLRQTQKVGIIGNDVTGEAQTGNAIKTCPHYNPDNNEWGCCTYDGFKYYYNEEEDRVCLGVEGADEGTGEPNGEMHEITRGVHWEEDTPCYSNMLEKDRVTNSNFQTILSNYVFPHMGWQNEDEDCWTACDYETNNIHGTTKDNGYCPFTYARQVNGYVCTSGTMIGILPMTSRAEGHPVYGSYSFEWDGSEGEKSFMIYEYPVATTSYHTETRERSCGHYENCSPDCNIDHKEEYEYSWTEYDTEEKVYQVWWDCKGHTGHYCGGHLIVEVNGIVYSMTDEMVASSVGGSDYEIRGLEDVDYSSFASATSTGLEWSASLPVSDENHAYSEIADGLNLYSETGQIWTKGSGGDYSKSTIGAEVMDDDYYGDGTPLTSEQIEARNKAKTIWNIFQCDMSIDYYKGIFPYMNYKDYEGWTTDNMEIAIQKYTQDWEGVYEFDLNTNFGSIVLSDTEVKAIVDSVSNYYSTMNGKELDEVRVEAITTALECVGRGQYSQAHHSHGFYMFDCDGNGNIAHGNDDNHSDGHLCNATDCSGFASYIFAIANGDRSYTVGKSDNGYAYSAGNTYNVYTTDTFISSSGHCIGEYNGNNLEAGDILIKTDGTKHAYVYIGEIDVNVQTSMGTLWSHDQLFVDCTRKDEMGNIYLEAYKDSADDTNEMLQNSKGMLTGDGIGNDVPRVGDGHTYSVIKLIN